MRDLMRRLAQSAVSIAGLILVALIISASISSRLTAQIPRLNLQGPGTLVGIVVDTAGVPIPGVEVSLPSLGWLTRSRANGAFRFDSVPGRSVNVRARGVGVVAPIANVAIGPNGGSVVIRMARLTQLMPDVVTRAARGGLTGVVVDSTLHPIPGVKVRALGGMFNTLSDSLGAYHMPLKDGRYLLRMDRAGFDRQTVGVTLDDSSSGQVVTILYGQRGKPNIIEGASLTELESRMMRASAPSSRYLSRDDLEELGLTQLNAIARRWSTGRLTNDCMVTLGPTIGMTGAAARKVPIDQFSADDLEFVEVYLPTMTGRTRGSRSINGARTAGQIQDAPMAAGADDCGRVSIIVWPRK